MLDADQPGAGRKPAVRRKQQPSHTLVVQPGLNRALERGGEKRDVKLPCADSILAPSAAPNADAAYGSLELG